MTRFSRLSRLYAIGILVGMLGATVWGWLTCGSLVEWSVGANRGTDDLELYRHIVIDMHRGLNYYDAAENTFAPKGSAMHSTFNWRLPTYAWLFGLSPTSDLFYWLFLLLTLLSVFATVRTFLMPACGPAGIVVGTLLLMGGAFSWCLYEHDTFLATEPWCEVLILFSLCAYAHGWWPAGMAAALAALALRELMLPYCLVAAALAIRRNRRSEWLLWFVCLALYAYLLSLHSQTVVNRHPNVPGASIDYWLHASGMHGILPTCVMNVFLRSLPNWLIAIYLPVALIGLIGWPGETGARLALSAGVYVIAYAFVWPADYWGYLYSPILVLGVVRAPAALCDLGMAAFGRRTKQFA